VRDGLDEGGAAQALLERVGSVRWGELWHAYGPASDVPAQLAAVVVGDDETRRDAWWNLWGNIHHQGTIYEATVPAVPVLLGLAGWRSHPDRQEALSMLREIGAAAGVSVWRFDASGEIVDDVAAGRRRFAELRAILVAGAPPLLEGWRTEPEPIRRALLWLLSVLPTLHARHEALIAQMLPPRHRAAWRMVVAGSAEAQEDADAVSDLEDWVHGAAEG
jgi:hypothetical protein